MLARVTGEELAAASTTPALLHDFLLGCFFNDDTQTLAGSFSCLLQKHKRYDFSFISSLKRFTDASKSCMSALPSFAFPFTVGWRSQDAWKKEAGSKGEMCPLIGLETRSKGICKYINYLQQGNDTTFPPENTHRTIFLSRERTNPTEQYD